MELSVPWHETRISNCSFCGRMIPRYVWVGEPATGNSSSEGEADIFCSEKCEKLAKQRGNDTRRHRKADAVALESTE